MDLVSVIIPIYGVEQYLDRCVRSVVNQSYAHLEMTAAQTGARQCAMLGPIRIRVFR